MKNYCYEVVCLDHRGWSDDSIWGDGGYDARADRIFATSLEAREIAQDLGDPANWRGPVEPARFGVVCLSIPEARREEHDEDVIARLTAIHGGPIRQESNPHGLQVGDRVQGGDPDTDDHDTGRIVAIRGNEAEVAWSCQQRTWTPLAGLQPL